MPSCVNGVTCEDFENTLGEGRKLSSNWSSIPKIGRRFKGQVVSLLFKLTFKSRKAHSRPAGCCFCGD